MKSSETIKCPHCEQDPASEPITAGELVVDLQSDEVITYFCGACDGLFTVEERLNAKSRPFTTDIILGKA